MSMNTDCKNGVTRLPEDLEHNLEGQNFGSSDISFGLYLISRKKNSPKNSL